jgi:hypothetical protein
MKMLVGEIRPYQMTENHCLAAQQRKGQKRRAPRSRIHKRAFWREDFFRDAGVF